MSTARRISRIAQLSLGACVFALPLGAGAAPFAYVPNSGDGTLSVIDTATNTVTATVAVGGFAVAVNRSGTRVYLTTAGGLAVLDTADNTVITTIPGVGAGVAVNPAGTRVYAVAGENSIAVIDAATNTIVTTVPVGGPPNGIGLFGLALSPDGALLYVGEEHHDESEERRPCFGPLYFCGGQIAIVDTATNAEVGGIPGDFIDNSLAGIVVDSTGQAWFTALSPDVAALGELEVAVFANGLIGIGTGTVLATPFALAVSPDGSRVYSAPRNTAPVAVIDTKARILVASIDISDGGYAGAGVAVTPDGSRVYSLASHSVAVIDAATNVVLEHIPVGAAPVAFGNFIGPAVIGTSPTPTSTPPLATATPTPTFGGCGDVCDARPCVIESLPGATGKCVIRAVPRCECFLDDVQPKHHSPQPPRPRSVRQQTRLLRPRVADRHSHRHASPAFADKKRECDTYVCARTTSGRRRLLARPPGGLASSVAGVRGHCHIVVVPTAQMLSMRTDCSAGAISAAASGPAPGCGLKGEYHRRGRRTLHERRTVADDLALSQSLNLFF